jgi:hypothetical protein
MPLWRDDLRDAVDDGDETPGGSRPDPFELAALRHPKKSAWTLAKITENRLNTGKGVGSSAMAVVLSPDVAHRAQWVTAAGPNAKGGTWHDYGSAMQWFAWGS